MLSAKGDVDASIGTRDLTLRLVVIVLEKGIGGTALRIVARGADLVAGAVLELKRGGVLQKRKKKSQSVKLLL